jgi:TPR repeat protein
MQQADLDMWLASMDGLDTLRARAEHDAAHGGNDEKLALCRDMIYGVCGEKNIPRAMAFLTPMARQDRNADAMYYLALCHHELSSQPDGEAHNIEKLLLSLGAACQDHALGTYLAASLIEHGVGLPCSKGRPAEAAKLYNRAAARDLTRLHVEGKVPTPVERSAFALAKGAVASMAARLGAAVMRPATAPVSASAVRDLAQR